MSYLPKQRFVAVVPLRGGSKSIPKKNTKPFCGKPLCGWALSAALACPEISEVWVSTESAEIAAVVRQLSVDIRIHFRPLHLAGDTSTTDEVLWDIVHADVFQTDYVVTLQATSPQTRPEDLSAAIALLVASGNDSLVTGVRVRRFFWRDDGTPINYDPARRPMRQDWPGTFMENGAFYISDFQKLMDYQPRLHGRIVLFDMPSWFGIELDEAEDWLELEREFHRQGSAT